MRSPHINMLSAIKRWCTKKHFTLPTPDARLRPNESYAWRPQKHVSPPPTEIATRTTGLEGQVEAKSVPSVFLRLDSFMRFVVPELIAKKPWHAHKTKTYMVAMPCMAVITRLSLLRYYEKYGRHAGSFDARQLGRRPSCAVICSFIYDSRWQSTRKPLISSTPLAFSVWPAIHLSVEGVPRLTTKCERIMTNCSKLINYERISVPCDPTLYLPQGIWPSQP